MIKFYRTDDRKIHEEGGIVPGGWIDMVNPTVAEGELIAKRLFKICWPLWMRKKVLVWNWRMDIR